MHYKLTGLYNKTGNAFVEAFRVLDSLDYVTSLNLRGNMLNHKSIEDLTTAFRRLSGNINVIDLSDNNLVHKNGSELGLILKNLPLGLVSLKLKNNGFGYFATNDYDLATVFKSLRNHTALTFLDLGNNQLNFLDKNKLKEGLAAIPVSVTDLDISDNNFYSLTDSEITSIFKTLSPNVETINLSYTSLDYKTTEELANILPVTVKSVIVNSTTISLDEYREEQEYLAEQALLAEQELLAQQEFQAQQEREAQQELDAQRILQEQQEAQAQKVKFLADLEPQLLIIEEKIKELEGRGPNCKAGYEAACALYTTLKEAKQQYIQDTIDFPEFREKSIAAIKTALTELENHRGWKEILANAALFIAGFGIGYLAVCAYKGSFFKLETDSANKLHLLQNQFESASPAA